MDEKRIYAVVAGTIQVPASAVRRHPLRTVIQPVGRQIAQVAHVVSKLRHGMLIVTPVLHTVFPIEFYPMTTIVLQARDSAEMAHVHRLLFKRRLNPVLFSDDNPEYGPGSWPTSLAVFATKKQVADVLDYLPLWGSQ